MNILFLSTENPYPPDHGHHIRTLNILEHLARHNNVYFIGFAKQVKELEFNKYLEALCSSVDVFLLPSYKSKLRSVISLIANLFSVKPFNVMRFFFKKAKDRITQIINENNIDLVHFDMLHLGMYYDCIGAIPKVLVNHNVESLRLARTMQFQKNIFPKIFIYVQYKKLLYFEKKMCPKFDKCIVVSDADKKILKRMCSIDNFEIVPNGVDIEYFKPSNGRIKSHSLVWTGGMAGLCNKDAVDYFLEEIYPIIKTKLPDVTATFIGSSPTDKLTALANTSSNIIATGYVDDVRPFVAESAVFVAPLRSGSGTKIKILNAMAQGKAVVTTTVGAEGIDAENNKNILITDDPEEFARNTIYLLEHPEAAKKMGENGRKLIEEKYAWEVIFKQMDQIYGAINSLRRNDKLI